LTTTQKIVKNTQDQANAAKEQYSNEKKELATRLEKDKHKSLDHEYHKYS
jgi:hypothetical protein